MDYLYRLVDLINTYDGSPEIEREMRNLICFLSENEEYKTNDLYRTVIFEASEKLRQPVQNNSDCRMSVYRKDAQA